LNVLPEEPPPLRERVQDIPLLVHYFLERYAAKIGRAITRVPREAMQRLMAYPWPGNVRELENVIERAVILSSGPELTVAPELLPVLPVVPAAAPARTDIPGAIRRRSTRSSGSTSSRSSSGPAGASTDRRAPRAS
jgi:formate hydrogenlyase transcriptional activator